MKICLQANDHAKENIHVSHDGNLGFAIWIGNGQVHIRAKDPHEPYSDRTTIVADASVELVK